MTENDYKSKIIVYLLQNQDGHTFKFNFLEMSKELNISFQDVVNTIKELQKENMITIYCPECSKRKIN